MSRVNKQTKKKTKSGKSEENIPRYGLKQRTDDKRDIKVHQLGGYFTQDISFLPEEFIVSDSEVWDQGNTLFCTLFSMANSLTQSEGVKLSVEWFAKEATKKYGENWINEGLQQRQACKLALKGALEASKVNHPLPQYGAEFVANPANYDTQQDQEALNHAQKAYVEIVPFKGLDLYDAIRWTIWEFRYEKRCPVIGTMWDGEWTNKTIITRDGNPVGGHQVFTNGWNKDGLIIQNSYGNITPQGRHVFTREMVNKIFSFGGVSMFVDMSAEEVERLKRRNSGSWWQWLLDFLSNWD